MGFEWNGKYDEEQVAPWLDRFNEVYDEIVASGKYTYNDSFKGRIPGIEGEREDTAIYLLQGLRRKREQEAKIEALKAEGYEELTELDETTRFKRVVFFPRSRMGGEWAEWEDARLIPERNEHQVEATGRVRGVIPKGKRTRGHLCMGRGVLVLR